MNVFHRKIQRNIVNIIVYCFIVSCFNFILCIQPSYSVIAPPLQKNLSEHPAPVDKKVTGKPAEIPEKAWSKITEQLKKETTTKKSKSTW